MTSMADHLAERAAFLKAFDDWCGPQAEALVRIGNAAFEVERIVKGIPMRCYGANATSHHSLNLATSFFRSVFRGCSGVLVSSTGGGP